MRIHFVNRFFWPAEPATAQLLLDLAESLARGPWSVSVVAGLSAPGLPRSETHAGIHIIRIGLPMAAGQELGRRALDFAFFHLAAMRTLWGTVKRGDVVVALSDPPLIGITAALIAKLRGARLVHWVHDIYPEVVQAVTNGFAAKLVTAALRPIRNLAWRSAAGCVTLSEDMAAILKAAGVTKDRLHIVANWAPQGLGPGDAADVRALRTRWDIGTRFVIGYSGNLGRVHDLSGVIRVAEDLQSDPQFLFLFMGHGASFAALGAAAAQRELTNVRFLPPRPRSELSVSLSVPDVHLIGLRPGCEPFVFPSKLYGATAVARPVLVLGRESSELARIVRQNGLGAVFRPDDAAGISSHLRELATDSATRNALSESALRFSRANGGAPRALTQWESILQPLAGTR